MQIEFKIFVTDIFIAKKGMHLVLVCLQIQISVPKVNVAFINNWLVIL